jgi:hypothetical protein
LMRQDHRGSVLAGQLTAPEPDRQQEVDAWLMLG